MKLITTSTLKKLLDINLANASLYHYIRKLYTAKDFKESGLLIWKKKFSELNEFKKSLIIHEIKIK